MDEIQFTSASASLALFLDTVSFKRFRVFAKHTGGTGDNTLAVEVLAGGG